MKDKKGNVNVSFSWVLVTIIGVFFLLTSSSLIQKYKEYKDREFEIEFKEYLEDIFKKVTENVDVSENKLFLVEDIFQDRTIDVSCQEGMIYLIVDDIFDQNNDLLKSNPVFTKKYVVDKGEDVYIGTQTYKLPFLVTNFFIITTFKNFIIFDSSSEEIEDLIENFKDSSFSELNYDIKNFSEISDLVSLVNNKIDEQNLKQVTIITDKDVNIDNIDVNTYILNYTFEKDENFILVNLTYKDQSGSEKHFKFIDYGDDFAISKSAIFSSPENFECANQMIDNILKITYDFKLDYSSYLFKITNENICTDNHKYFFIKNELNDSINNIDNKEVFKNHLKDIEKENNELIEKGCLPVY